MRVPDGSSAPVSAPVTPLPLVSSIQRNAVALISLAVALAGTSYNTWRNQTTEAHRNVREASFKLLEQSAELQQLAQQRYFGSDHSPANWIAGWGKATLIRDIAPLVSPRAQERADALFATWKLRADELESGSGDSEAKIEAAIDALSNELRDELRQLH
jgi:hypothetical protein